MISPRRMYLARDAPDATSYPNNTPLVHFLYPSLPAHCFPPHPYGSKGGAILERAIFGTPTPTNHYSTPGTAVFTHSLKPMQSQLMRIGSASVRPRRLQSWRLWPPGDSCQWAARDRAMVSSSSSGRMVSHRFPRGRSSASGHLTK